MSKRYLKKLVDNRDVDGWDDPRMPTLAGLRRRGFTPASIREFCERIGAAKANSEVSYNQLESCIREELNASAPRVMAVLEPLELELINRPADFGEELDFEYTLGEGEPRSQRISFSNKLYIESSDFALDPPPKFHRLTAGGTVRLKSAYIIRCTDAVTDKTGRVIKVKAEIIEGTKSGSDSPVKAKGVIHWVNAKTAFDIEARIYDHLLRAGDENLDFSERLNSDSLTVLKAKADKSLFECKKGERFQFLRQGYFCRDIKSDGAVFNRIVGLKDSFSKESFTKDSSKEVKS
jgi:glutaminyl-tRNA synthetase